MFWHPRNRNRSRLFESVPSQTVAFVLLSFALVGLGVAPYPAFCEDSNPTVRSSQPSQVESVRLAQKYYREGENEKAIQILDQVLAVDPSDSIATQLLSEILIAGSVEDYLLGQEEKSYDRLARALKLTPDAESANRLYEKIKKEKYLNLSSNSTSKPGLPQDAAQFQQMVSKLVQGQKELMSQNRESLGQIVQEAASQKKEILTSLEKREDWVVREIKYGRKASVFLILFAVLGVVLIVSIVLYVVQKISARRDQMLMEQSKEFIQLVQDQSQQNLSYIKEGLKEGLEHLSISATFTAPSLPSPTGSIQPSPALPYEDNSASKLRKIEIIDAEIVLDGKTPVTKDQEVLSALLEDPDPAVRARTIQVIFKTNPAEAYARIEEMLSNSLVGVRLIGIRLLSGMANPRSVKILIGLLSEKDSSVKRESISALRSLLGESLDASVKKEINQALSSVSEKEGWIIQ